MVYQHVTKEAKDVSDLVWRITSETYFALCTSTMRYITKPRVQSDINQVSTLKAILQSRAHHSRDVSVLSLCRGQQSIHLSRD